MYCPKCGTELRSGLAFCPKCGARLSGSDQSPRSGVAAVSAQTGTSKQKGKLLLAALWERRIACCLIGCTAFFVLFVSFFFRSGSAPDLAEADSVPLLREYLEQQLSDSKQQKVLEACLLKEGNDLTDQIAERLSTALEPLGITLNGSEQKEGMKRLKNGMSDYSKQHPEIAKAFAGAVSGYSELTVTKQEKKGKKLYAEVTVSYLDRSAVNRNLLETMLSAEQLLRLFMGNNLKQAFSEFVFSTDKAEWLLNGFLETADTVQERSTYTGTAEFSYNKQTGRWEILSVEDGLFEAYVGAR